MALTSAQKAQIRELLGWSAMSVDDGPGYRLDSSMIAIANRPDEEARIVDALEKCDALTVRIEGAYDRLKASAVGSITLNPREIAILKSEGRRQTKIIAALLGVEIRPGALFGGGGGGGEVRHG